jgi:hypothetical protein
MIGAGNTDGAAAGFAQFEVFRQRPDRKIRCFLSHSLGDPGALDKLIAALPAHVDAVTFPRLSEAPSDTLSKALLEKIGSCDVLVYLRGGLSETSLWMSFERRYARRRNMEVYSFDPASREVKQFTEVPHNIIIPLMIRYQGEDDDTRVYKVLQWLLSERNVDSTIVSLPNGQQGKFDVLGWEEANKNMRLVGLEFHSSPRNGPGLDRKSWDFYRALRLGGTVVLFLTNAACEVPWPHADLYLDVLARDGGDPTFDRPKVVWLDPPDSGRIEAAFERLGDRPDNLMFRAAVRKSIQSLLLRHGEDSTRPLDEGIPLWRALLLDREREIDWKQVDTLLIDLEFVAQRRRTRAPDARFESQEQAAKREARQAVERMQHSPKYKVLPDDVF